MTHGLELEHETPHSTEEIDALIERWQSGCHLYLEVPACADTESVVGALDVLAAAQAELREADQLAGRLEHGAERGLALGCHCDECHDWLSSRVDRMNAAAARVGVLRQARGCQAAHI